MLGVRINFLAIALLALLLFLQYRLWFEDGGIQNMLTLKRSLALQAQETEKMKKRNEELIFQVQRLQNSPDAVESRARNELGMVKKGETFYQIVK
jgi:cell division protein FtsB